MMPSVMHQGAGQQHSQVNFPTQCDRILKPGLITRPNTRQIVKCAETKRDDPQSLQQQAFAAFTTHRKKTAMYLEEIVCALLMP